MDDAALEWLLASEEPGIRFQARRDLLGEVVDNDPAEILRSQQHRRGTTGTYSQMLTLNALRVLKACS